MLIVVSPAKALDYESEVPTDQSTIPSLLDQSQKLVDVMATKTPAQLSELMSISDELATLNVERFNDFELPFTPANARPAMYAFNGDTYQGLDAAERFAGRKLNGHLKRAQSTLRILSGLYGVLRPLDLMQPYRLEMGTVVDNPGGSNLYEFWGDTITEELNTALEDSPGERVVVNLASNEYFKSVKKRLLDAPVVAPRFLDQPINGAPGDYKTISYFAKRARGSMAGWIIANRVEHIDQLVDFEEHGYRYDESRSTAKAPTFIRDASWSHDTGEVCADG